VTTAVERESYQAALTTQWLTRRCCHRNCNMPVVTVVAGQESLRGPGGILVMRGRPDRNYCVDHAPGLLLRAEAAA
jgi:hypothetical protein